jgi:hypothetical protein
MREHGIPKLLSWRWAPCAALVLGSLSFVAFVSLTIPERIGDGVEGASTSTLRLGNHLARTQTATESSEPNADWSSDDSTSNTPPPPVSPQSRMATVGTNSYPKRGFSPPLDRPEPPPAPPAPAAPPPPTPAVTLIPPPVPQPDAAPPAPPPQQLATQPEAPPPPVAPPAE